MKKVFKKIFNSKTLKNGNSESNPSIVVVFKTGKDSERHQKIEKGAEDFAMRFEGVMRELSNG